MSGTGAQLLPLLAGLAVSGVLRVSAMEVFTSGELEAVNGTDAKLKCTFDSTNKVSLATTSVSWNFKPVGRGAEESVFYYQEEPYPPTNGRFKGRAVWAGNIERYDASIILRDVQFSDNGTYTCQVKNPPDVHGTAGEVRLRVVLTASHSEIMILAAAVGGTTLVVLLLVSITVIVKFYLKRRRQRDPTESKEASVL
ncbi:myelin protein zero-like protein 2 [Amia ocellicauda]|uniref:myelin protein zero-like protein 2 n=1 Tax=Amia ocellicauda TaxID=2972642 RepID=UPI0034646371